jgi:cysteinyl-tRNA synthetase
MAFRLFLLGGHYRSQLDFTTEAMDAAQATLRRLVARIQPLRPLPAADTLSAANALGAATASAATASAANALSAAHALAAATAAAPDSDLATARALDQIDAAIAADLSTPKILATLQDTLRDPAITPDGLRALTAAADALLGLSLGTLDPADLEQRRSQQELAPDERHAIEHLVAERTQARKERDWARADRIRAELDERGVQVTDTSEGPVWQLR